MRRLGVAALVAVAGCQIREGGIATQPAPVDAPVEITDDTGPRPETVTAPEGGGKDIPGPAPPEIAGCADGTREGFADRDLWPKVAACAGGFSVPGLLADGVNLPHCARAAGNSGPNPTGAGCAATDLCATGWHVCVGLAELARKSSSGCDGAAASGERLFFAARIGASPSGVCSPTGKDENNLHGCGNIGLDELPSCRPFDRTLGIADCRTLGIWSCGGTDDWLREAAVVTKEGPDLGGVLCCTDV